MGHSARRGSVAWPVEPSSTFHLVGTGAVVSMPLIPELVLDEIQSRVEIAELIGRYVPLKRAGRHFKALCPFHQERTPSFHINVDKQIFHCFGCGVGGNVFSFLMQRERLTFPEAVHQLAEQARVEIPQGAEASRNGHTDQLYAMLEKTCRYYERLLAHPREGRVARAYLRTRGVAERTRQAYRLGCAPMAGWDRLVQAAKKTSPDPGLLERAGLIVRGRRGLVDRFRQRLLFPIQDGRGRVVGFGGRSLAGQEPKYLNSPDTPLYQKGRSLFGLPQAKDAMLKAKSAILVEGYFDCVLLWQHGVTHVVSPLGTALTLEQARLLGRYAQHVVLAFDADAAGEAATLRGIDVLVANGFEVRVAQLPTGVDPDEYIQARGLGAFTELLGQALGVLEWLIRAATNRYDIRSAEGKVRAAQFVLPTVATVPNAMLRAEYVRLLAERFVLQEHAVAEELRKIQPRTAQPVEGRVPRREGARLQGAERMVAALVLDQPSRWDAVERAQLLSAITDEQLRRIVAAVGEMRAMSHADPTPAQVISRFADDEPAVMVAELVQLAQTVAHRDQAFQECVRRLKSKARQERLAGLQTKLATAQQAGRERDVSELLKQYQQMVKAHDEE